MRRRRAAASWCWPRRNTACASATSARAGRDVRAVHRADAHERRGPRTAVRSAKGAADAIERYVHRGRRSFPRDGAQRTWKRSPARAARRWSWPKAPHVLGVIQLKDIVKGGIRERFAELRRMGIKTVMITGDNPLTAAAIAAEAGVDDFLAEATPEAQAQADPRIPGRRPAGGDDRRRHQRRAGAGPGRRGCGDEHRHPGGQGSRQHGRSRLQSDQADRDRGDRQAAADDPRRAHDLQHRQRRGQVLRHHPGGVRRHLSGAERV